MHTSRWTISDYINIGFNGFPAGGLVSIDVTFRCNMNCIHCYFRHQGYDRELSLKQWMTRLEELRTTAFSGHICGWLGGEPLLRPDVIYAGKKFFKSNIIFTNGTLELPPWNDCTFVVSIPGTKREYCSITGGSPETYELVKRHSNRPDLRVIASFCITRMNVSSISKFLSEWKRLAGIRAIFFEFYTPRKDEGKELWLDWAERDRIIDELLHLKRTYGDFIYNSPRMLRLMQSKNIHRILSNCPFPSIGLSLDPMGNVKLPCILGPEADCNRCGCILPIFSYILSRRRLLLEAFARGIKGKLSAWRFPRRNISVAPTEYPILI